MKLLSVMRPRPGVDVAAEVARHADAELRKVWELYRDGLVRELYAPAGPGAVLILEATSAEDGANAVRQLPLLANEIMELELIELRPFTALQVLFASAAGSEQ